MAAFKSDLLRTLSERGFIHQISDSEALDKLAVAGPITGYIGFDCTAPSFHVGNLVSIMMLRWMQKTGHRPIALMGGGTTRVGDPSGKDDARKLLTYEEIDANKDSLKQTFARFIDFGAPPTGAIMVDNAEWLAPLNYIDFLRGVGRHFSVNRMLAMDSVKLRLEREHELSFLEFNYMVLQAYDFTELARRHGCTLQLGGSDQWGNIVNGIDLGRRLGLPQLYALTTPLITTSSGAKMGKTASGAVWLNADLLSPHGYWQFWRDIEDAYVGRFLRLFTELPLDEIGRLNAVQGAELNDAKKKLATEATALLHGRQAALQAETGSLEALPIREADDGDKHQWLVGRSNAALLHATGLVTSMREARQKISDGGVSINNKRVPATDANEIVPWDQGPFTVQLRNRIVVVKRKPT